MNIALLVGTLSSEPVERALPSGDRLVSYEVTVREAGQATASVPVVWVEAPAPASRLPAGAEVLVTGRIRRRFFRAGGATASRTEVVADLVVRTSQRTKVERALSQVAQRASTESLAVSSS